MTVSTSERLAKVHSDAMLEFDSIQIAVRDERIQCLQDRRFYSVAGAQWEGPLEDQFENKPKFEFNKTHLAVMRIINEYRNNRIDVDFTAKPGASENDDMADVCNGLYRADEQDSGGEEAFDNGFEEAVGGGIGAWRLRAVYEDDEDDENTRQRVAFEPIYDADASVFFSLDSKRQDKSDAKRCFVLTRMDLDAYKEEYGDDPASWPNTINQRQFDWCTPDDVVVAEYYQVEEQTQKLSIYRPAWDDDEQNEQTFTPDELTPQKQDVLRATGMRLVREKKIKRRRVHKYVMNGAEILKDEGYIAGSYIPIVMCFGKHWVVDGIERCQGHVRLAKDAQRLANMVRSKIAEMSAMSSLEKPIMDPAEVKGHAQMWANDNIKNWPYLLKNTLKDANGNPLLKPQEYTKVANLPPAMAAMIQMLDGDMQELLGNQQAGEEIVSNISEKTVEMIQQKLDMQVYIYMSNFAKAKKWTGKVWLSMMRDITVEDGREMKAVDSNNQMSTVVVNQPAFDEETGEQFLSNNIERAYLDVGVEVGPSSASRRSATVRALTSVMQVTQDPETLSVLSLMVLQNMEGEGVSEARDWARQKLVAMGVAKPTDEEAEQIAKQQQAQANQPPDPQSQYLLSAAQESEANAAQARAKTIDTIADAGLKDAQRQKTLAEAGATANQVHIDTADAVQRVFAPNPPP